MNDATLSPDGHSVAFGSPASGVAQVFLMLTSGGEPLQLTNDEGDKDVGGTHTRRSPAWQLLGARRLLRTALHLLLWPASRCQPAKSFRFGIKVARPRGDFRTFLNDFAPVFAAD